MFEYIFYRLYLTYKKHEPNTNPSFSATLALSAFQICMVGGVMIVLSGVFGIDVLPKNSVVGKIIALVFTALLALYNYKHYTPKIEEMDEKYANYKAKPTNGSELGCCIYCHFWLYWCLLHCQDGSMVYYKSLSFSFLLHINRSYQ